MKNITAAGNVGKDAETRTVGQNGNKVTSFSLAVNHFDGKEKSTVWFDVQMWGKRGEAMAQFARKGQRMAVTGDLSTREYEGKTYLQINASDFTPMSPREDQGQQSGGGYDSGPSGGYGAPATAGAGDIDDEIPFKYNSL